MNTLKSYTELNSLGLKYRTDKSSSGHNYLPYYEFYLSRIRSTCKSVLEIGVFEGASLSMWADFFPNATIYGIDKNFPYSSFNARIRFYLLDSKTQNFEILCKRVKPCVIIDDGEHSMLSHQVSFELAFPHMPSGGFYFIEDLAQCYSGHHGGYSGWHGTPPSDDLPSAGFPINKDKLGHHGRTVDWLAELSHAVNFRHLDTDPDILKKYPYYKQISEIHFTQGLCLIVKE